MEITKLDQIDVGAEGASSLGVGCLRGGTQDRDNEKPMSLGVGRFYVSCRLREHIAGRR